MKIKTLEQCLSLVIDHRGLTPKKLQSDWADSGYRVFSANNVKTSGIVNLDEIRYIDESTYKKWMKDEIQRGDILLTSEAPAGEVYYWDSREKIVTGQRVYGLRTNNDVDPLYLKYYLQSKIGQNEIKKFNSGSTVFGISAKTFNYIKVYLPDDISEQEKIGKTLYEIDEKVANNNAITQQLEAMAKTIYDYWFLQFEFPNEEGKPYKSSGGKMVWSEELQREIPAGWEVADLVNNPLTKLIKPGIKKFSGTKRYLATADVNGTSYSTGSNITFDNRESRANMQPTLNSVWFAKMKDSIKHLYLNKELNSMIEETVLSTGFCGIQCEEHSFEYLASFIESDYFEKIKNQLAHGATQQAVNNVDLQSVKLVIPSEGVVDKFHEVTKNMFSMISKNKVENINLTTLRDFLLPLLMNGQVSVLED